MVRHGLTAKCQGQGIRMMSGSDDGTFTAGVERTLSCNAKVEQDLRQIFCA